MTNAPLLVLLESVLGPSLHKKDENYAFHCPNCNHEKPKLEVSLSPVKDRNGKIHQSPYKCWVCGESFRGSSIHALFRRLEVGSDIFQELNKYSSYKYESKDRIRTDVILPKEYKRLSILDKYMGIDYLVGKQCLKYLRSRNITDIDIDRYQIGFCSTGNYAYRIIMPSFDKNGHVNYFVARKNNDSHPDIVSYLKPIDGDQNIVPCEYWVDFKEPIRLVEGMMDMYASRFNTVPTLGLGISEELDMRLLMESEDIYIGLDNDSAGYNKLVEYLNYYNSFGKRVYLVDFGGKDPSSIGFEATQRAFDKAVRYDKMLKMKMKMKDIKKKAILSSLKY